MEHGIIQEVELQPDSAILLLLLRILKQKLVLLELLSDVPKFIYESRFSSAIKSANEDLLVQKLNHESGRKIIQIIDSFLP